MPYCESAVTCSKEAVRKIIPHFDINQKWVALKIGNCRILNKYHAEICPHLTANHMNRVILIGFNSQKYQSLKSSVEEVIDHIEEQLVIEEQNEIEGILSQPVKEIPAIIFRNKVLMEGGDIPPSEDLEAKIRGRIAETTPLP